MKFGYTGKIAYLDLEDHQIKLQKPEEELYEKYLGGYGIGVKILYEKMKSKIDPLGEKNILGFTTGPLTGTGSYIGSRYMVCGKSPLTGGWGDANSGGKFGPTLKRAGYDAIFLQKKSKNFIYIYIDSNDIEVREADHLKGKDTYETEDTLKEELGEDIEIACIGPSGENLIKFAGICTDKGRFAARSGLGAVMGSKKVKAIAVRDEESVKVYDRDKLNELNSKYIPQFQEGLPETLSELGTGGPLGASIAAGDTPVKNWSKAGEKIFPNGEKMGIKNTEEYQDKKYACEGCPIGCGGIQSIKNGSYQVDRVHKTQYETLGAFGPLCLNDNLESIIYANDICNRYGIDTISTGASVAFAIECYENDLLTKEDTDGLELTWGNSEAIVKLTEKIARREGFGEIFANGLKEASKKIGERSKKYAMHIDGEGLPMHDPRWGPGLATTYITDATPARHTQGSETFPPAGIDIPDLERTEFAGRGKIHKETVVLYHAANCAGLCLFGYISAEIGILPEYLKAATGMDFDINDLKTIGERVANLRHLFNLREDKRFSEYDIPNRIIGKPPLEKGPTKEVTLDTKQMINDYLDEMKWDRDTLKPKEEKLNELNLNFVDL